MIKIKSKKNGMKKYLSGWVFSIWAVFSLGIVNAQEKGAAKANAGLTIPAGFSASVVADNLGRARHLVVTPQGDIYVRLARPVDGKGTLVLHETNGKATVTDGFGNYGGTGIALKDGYLYASS